MLDCWSVGQVIDFTLGSWVIPKIHMISFGCPRPSIALIVQNGSLKHQSFHFISSPVSPLSAESWLKSPFISFGCWRFFVVEDHILNTTQGLVDRVYIDDLWEMALGRVVAVLRTHIVSTRLQYYSAVQCWSIMLKDYSAVLCCSIMLGVLYSSTIQQYCAALQSLECYAAVLSIYILLCSILFVTLPKNEHPWYCWFVVLHSILQQYCTYIVCTHML